MDNLIESNDGQDLIESKDDRDEICERLKEKLALLNNKQDELMERLQIKLNKSREEIQSIIYEL